MYLEELHDLLHQRPFEDQLVLFPGKVIYQNLLVFCQLGKAGRSGLNVFS